MGITGSNPQPGYFFQEDFLTPNLGEPQVISVYSGTNVNVIESGSYEEFLQYFVFILFLFLFIWLGENLIINWPVIYDVSGFLFMFLFLFLFIHIGKRILSLWVGFYRDALYLYLSFAI